MGNIGEEKKEIVRNTIKTGERGKYSTNGNGNKKSSRLYGIYGQMVKQIIVPTFCILIVVAIVIILIAQNSVSKIRTEEITAESEVVAGEISEYVMKYMEVTKQLAANNGARKLFEDVGPGDKIQEAENFENMRTTLTNVKNTDPDNILAAWLGDVDASMFFEDTESGYVSPQGEWDITSRDWYKSVSEAGTTIISEPYVNSSDGQMISTVVTPIYESNGEMLGVAAVDITVSVLDQIMAEKKLGDTGYFFLLTKAGTIMHAPQDSVEGKSIYDINMPQNVIDTINKGEDKSFTYHYNGKKVYGHYSVIGNTGWSVLSAMPSAEYNEVVVQLMIAVILCFAIAIALLIFILNKIAAGIVKPLKNLKNVADKIADGDLDVSVDVNADDEVGAVGKAITKTIVRLKDYIVYIDEITAVLNQVADGNLKFELKQEYAGEFKKIKVGLENLSERLIGTLRNIDEASLQVAGGSDQIANGAQALADGATSQAATVEELQASVTEIAEQVDYNAGYTEQARKKMNVMTKELESGNQQMDLVVTAMNEISECSSQIEEIITSIESIASQTNLLSLNASIEAARAGEMGRGFSVVAGEVGKLSAESMGAVQTSTSLIQNSLQAVRHGTEIVNKTSEQLKQALTHVEELQGVIAEIDEASRRQNEQIQQIHLALEQVTEVVTDNSAMAEESAAASEQLSSQSQNLAEMLKEFII